MVQPLQRHTSPSRLSLAAVLAASLLASACGTAAPGQNVATVRSSEAARLLSIARTEGEREVSSWSGPALTAEDAGLDGPTFNQFDQDGDGKLSLGEQMAVYRAVWDEMSTIAQTNRSMAAEETLPASYHPPHRQELTPTKAELFMDAEEILPAVIQTLQGAERTIRLDLFLLGGSQGQKIAELLVAKFKAGVDVRILHDPSFGLAGETQAQIVPVVQYLLTQGIRVKPYPLSYLPHRHGQPLANAFQIDHDKFLVVDEQVAMLGSMNLIDVGVMNHDAYFRLTGGVAQELAAIHDATWQLKGPALPDFGRPQVVPAPHYALEATGAADGSARLDKTDIDQQTTKQALLDAIAGATKSVHICIYEFGDTDIANALVQASRRGIDVRVIADTNSNYAKYLSVFKHVKLHGTPNLVTTNILRDAGVPVKWYVAQAPGQELHMKMAVIDHERMILGSTNFTYQAFNTFRETSAEVLCPQTAAKMEATFEQDWDKHARPVVKPTYFEKVTMVAVRLLDKVNLSWW